MSKSNIKVTMTHNKLVTEKNILLNLLIKVFFKYFWNNIKVENVTDMSYSFSSTCVHLKTTFLDILLLSASFMKRSYCRSV